MSAEQTAFLSLRNLPARLTMQQVAWLLGFNPADVTALVAARLLKPLGNPPKTGSKYFASITVAELRNNPAWLAKASDAIVRYWQDKNASRTTALPLDAFDSAA
jgi:hypothetical protein